MGILVAPSILSADFSKLGFEIHNVVKAGADWIHVDVMDGHFVPNLTIGPPVVASLRKTTDRPLDVHLMIENPEKFVPDFIAAGSDYITIHVESTKDPRGLLQAIRAQGKKAGITLRPATSVDLIIPFLKDVDLVLVMTVEPGFSGQKFMEDQIPKIRKIRQELDKVNPAVLIEVDGGINMETGRLCYQAGATVFVAGNFIFKNDYKKAITELKALS